MAYYLLLAYYMQCFRSYHHLNKTDSYTRTDNMQEFNEVVMQLLESSSMTEYFGGYKTIENIWDLTS
jgi:hypothetical protein